MRLRFVPTITLCFNPRTRVGCDFLMRRSRLLISGFNPRTRVGCDDRPPSSFCSSPGFQSTHPRGVRRRTCQPQICRRLFQSTHPRGVRLPVMRRRFQPHHVSIHAPAWGATPAGWCRPRSGGTCFNPRTRVGCDISPKTMCCWMSSFNPRTRVGCDGVGEGAGRTTRKFQSTHPRGVRLDDVGACALGVAVSIHAPAWGATCTRVVFSPMVVMFQSTHPRGVRLRGLRRQGHRCAVSIHAPAWGATKSQIARCPPLHVSIHAPAWGATCQSRA